MPFKSAAQRAYFNIHRKELEAQGVNVDEWNAASKGLKLPERASLRGMAESYYKRNPHKRPKS